MAAKRHRVHRWAAPLLALGVCAPGPLRAQALEGRVWDARSDRPIPSALLRLVDADGTARTATAADSTGRFRLPVPGPGTYRVRAEQIGYDPYESGPLDVADSAEVRMVEVVMRASPIQIRGVEVSAERVDSRLRALLGVTPSQLRVRPVREPAIRDYAMRGGGLPDLIHALQIPSMQVLRTSEGPCYQHRGRGCLPVYLDGTRLIRSSPGALPLEMIGTIVILLPNEVISYPQGAVHLYTVGFIR